MMNLKLFPIFMSVWIKIKKLYTEIIKLPEYGCLRKPAADKITFMGTKIVVKMLI